MIYRDTDLAWAAGFLEADGTFCLNVTRDGRNVSALIQVQQVDKLPVQHLHKMFGGSLRQASARKNQKAAWSWVVNTGFARDVLPLLIPYMVGEKKTQAEFLHIFCLSLEPQNGIRVSKKEIERRYSARQALSGMKLKNAV